MLENDADISIENDDGKSALDLALENTSKVGREKIIKMLLKAKANEFEDRQIRLKYLKKALF